MRRLLVRSGRRPRGVPWPQPTPATPATAISSSTTIPSTARLLGARPPHVQAAAYRAFSSSSSSSSSQPPPQGPPAAGAAVADGTEPSSSLTAPDPEAEAAAAAARQAFLSMLEPADAAHAVLLLEAAEQETGRAFPTTIGACNAYLIGLAKTNDAALLSKAFDYLGAFRGRLPPSDQQYVPSISARHNLIRACGRCVRGINQTLAAERPRAAPPDAEVEGPRPRDRDRERGDSILLFSSLPASLVSRATVAKFTELAEALFQDYAGSRTASAVVEGEEEKNGLGLLLSDMIYTYLHAGETRKALDLFERMRRAKPTPVFPDEYATSAIVKALARADKPEESFHLLEELEAAGVPVHIYPGLYLAVLRAIVRALAAKPPQAEKFRRIAQATLGRMRERGLVPPVAVLQGWMRVEAKFGHYREVKNVLAEMRARSLVPGQLEYSLLIGALGEGGNPQGVEGARRQMAADGVAADERVYLALLRAYDKSGDVARARAVFAEATARMEKERWHESLQPPSAKAQQQGLRPGDPRRLYTAMLRCLVRGQAAQEALDLFQGYRRRCCPAGEGTRKGKGGAPFVFPPPDEGMCAVALRAASAVGGAEAAKRLYDELAREEDGGGGGWSALGGNTAASLLAAHVDAGDWDGAYALFDRIRAAQAQQRKQQPGQWRGGRQQDGEGPSAAAGAQPYLASSRAMISPYNVLIHGLVKQGRHEEARTVAERAREDGVPFDGTTFRGLAKAAGGEMLLPWAREDWQPPARVYLVKEEAQAAGRQLDDEDEEGEDEERAGSEGALWLDMHRLTAAQATELLARELGKLRERFDAARGEGEKGKEELVGSVDDRDDGDDDGLRDLVLVTGYRKRQRRPPQEGEAQGGEAELKTLVRELLAARGLLFFHPPHNPGCFRVPRASLREYFERERKAESELRFFRLTLLRYIPVASLVALVALVPKGGLPL